MFIEYPKALYKDGIGSSLEELPCVVVASREEEDAKNAEGWFEIGTAPAQSESDPDDIKAGLRAQLEPLGVQVDNRWGVKRLQEELAKVSP